MGEPRQFTTLEEGMPPMAAPIEWITPSGRIVRGTWQGGTVWMPEGSSMYVYYRPISWRLTLPDDQGGQRP